MTIVPVIFTYSLDGPCAIEAAGALRDSGFARVFVFEDAHRPLEPATRSAIAKHAVMLKSYHPNPGGQYGLECLKGIISCHARALDLSGADYVLEVDSDTIVHRTGRIIQAAKDGVSAAAMSWPGCSFAGCCALISKRTIHHAVKLLADPPPWIDRERCPEDSTIGKIADGVGTVVRWPYCESGGFGAGYRYGTTPLSEYARRFDVVTLGNRALIPGRPCEKRETVAVAMSRLRAEYRRLEEREAPAAPVEPRRAAR